MITKVSKQLESNGSVSSNVTIFGTMTGKRERNGIERAKKTKRVGERGTERESEKRENLSN